MSEVEEVLVVQTKVLEKILGDFMTTGGCLKASEAQAALSKILVPKNLLFLERPHAEKDESFKQIIPYTIVRRGNEVFRYRRTKMSGETRLVGKSSIGVGGHINSQDQIPLDDTSHKFTTTYETAFWRELKEEIDFSEKVEAPIIGLIYEADTEVGRVHLGIVHQIRVKFDTKLTFNDPAIGEGEFRHIMELKEDDTFEGWSKMVLKNLL